MKEWEFAQKVQELVVRNNKLIAERDAARKLLVDTLRDIAYAKESEARGIARRALAGFDPAEAEDRRAA